MEKEAYGWILVGVILLLLTSGMLMGVGHMGIGGLLMVIFWIAVIWLMFSLIDDKKEKYQKISKMEFDKIKKEIVDG
ncbi:hypothetical protein HYY70_04560 [Candidatus Woesearchaeota archaeon]|nr:hypothetical protein [Candidatus Woesearchaeota archaeon]